MSAILNNRHVITALSALAIAQVLKFLFNYWRTKNWSRALLFGTGGMPSSHSAMAAALCVSIGLGEGFETPIFAISLVLALVVMHDAAGIRRAAGEQAGAINFLSSKLEAQGIKLDRKLKELLGHHPIEVLAGGVLGTLVAFGLFGLFW